ncbi:beta strand repeat-containing protein [Acidicapsa ligni]|uniref:beta strand repeat-containing protein n=1 Tax=Acidicapsa ligni TaxID=542300 RepID=UPI0021DFD870|nr:chitobiase/beta-hexosaminidase C-terminal domain-containing protein [Acidicapsa ligni]
MRILSKIVGSRLAAAGIALVGALMMVGCGGGSSSSSPGNATATPSFSPAAGSYTTSQRVTISDTTVGAVLYCTTDGTTPTTSSPKCAQPSTVFQTEFLQALAVAPGSSPSAVASAGYTINLNAVATPTFSPAGATYASPQMVTIADATPGANIYYTTDGSVPTTSSSVYGAPINVSTSETLTAIAMASGLSNSEVASAAYTIGQGGASTAAATPTFSPAAGTYSSSQTVTISDTSAGVSIHYTIDGSTPTDSSATYSGPITVSTTETINAIATGGGFTDSTVASAAYTIAPVASNPAVAPTFSPAAGTFTSAQTVSISDASAGVSIHYTVDGSTPTDSSATYSSPIAVSKTETIKAIATGGGFTDSTAASATYTISSGPAATPTFSPAAGSYASAQTVTISDATSGVTIHYTIDGSNPTDSSATYSGPITVSSTETVQAIATGNSYTDSPVASAAYSITSGPAAMPTFSPVGGTYTTTQTVSIADASVGSIIHYTIDGSTPTDSSATYSGPITVSSTETVKAIATGNGYTDSSVASVTYTISAGPAITPTFSPVAGTYASTQTVTIADASPGVSIHYTIDGSTPTDTSMLYSGPVTVSATEVIKALATGNNYTDSPIALAAYTINTGPAASPTFTPTGGSFTTSPQVVTLATTSTGASIYYTLNSTAPGNPPTHGSQLYTGPITLPATTTINAIAGGDGFSDSPASTQTFALNVGTAAMPTITPGTGNFTSTQTVTITGTSPNSVIYYTLDGSAPSSVPNPAIPYSASIYNGPFTIPSTATVKAIEGGNGYVDSAVASSTLTITSSAVAAPIFIPGPGILHAVSSNINFGSATPGATIYCTFDGSTPQAIPADACGRSLYPGNPATSNNNIVDLTNAPFTLKAIAVVTGQPPSEETDGTYTYELGTADVPTFSPNPTTGLYTNPITVSLTQDQGPLPVMYYTTDGSTPTTSSPMYISIFQAGGGIPISSTTTIKVLTVGNGYDAAPVVTGNFVFNQAVAATPVITPATGTYAGSQTITIIDPTPGATIYYTDDGTAPTTGSSVYSGPITVSSTETIQAIAVVPTFANSSTASATITISAGGSVALTGKVLSGTAAVSGSQVQLYQASQANYGATGSPLGASVSTGADGTFSISYTCPANPNDLLYLIATGGDAGQGDNSSLEFMAGLGSCNSMNVAAPIVMNEATTVASAYALSPFMVAPPDVGTSGSNYQGLANAFQTISSMVNLASGQVLAHTPDYPAALANDPTIVNNSTVPQSRINTLANALNACASLTGGGCTDLFAAATPSSGPSSGTAPTTTLQAILNIAQNPGMNVATLFTAAPASGPFQPVLGAAPGDWTLALTFTGGGLGIAPGLVTASGFDPVFANGLAVDASGNILITAYATSGFGSDNGSNMLAIFNSQGAPQTPATTALPQGAGDFPLYGGLQSTVVTGPSGSFAISGPSGLAIDGTGNIWLGVGGFNHGVSELSSTYVPLQGYLENSGFHAPGGLAVDANNNLWESDTNYLQEYGPDGTQLSPNGSDNTTLWNGASAVDTFGFESLAQLVFDSSSNLWAEDTDSFGDMYLINQSTGAILYDPWFSLVSTTGEYTPLVADGAGNIYGCGALGNQTLNVFAATQTTPPTGTMPNSYMLSTGRGCGTQMVLDGLGRIFAMSPYNLKTSMPPGVIDEFTTTGVSISPTATGYTGTGGGEAPTINADFSQTVTTNYVPGMAMDGSGNLWVLNTDTGAPGTTGNVLVKYVGIGAPVLTPTALALQFGEIGVRP